MVSSHARPRGTRGPAVSWPVPAVSRAEIASWVLPVSLWDNWPGDLLVVIACSGSKLDHVAPAAELYTGSLFRLALRAARSLVPDDQIRVLSARHGFVALDHPLAPYNTTWETSTISAPSLSLQAQLGGIGDGCDVLSLCPAAYWIRVRAVWPHAINGLFGLRGIGQFRRELSAIASMPYQGGEPDPDTDPDAESTDDEDRMQLAEAWALSSPRID